MSIFKQISINIKKTSKSFLISLVLLGSIISGIAAFQVVPNLSKTPKVSAAPVCPSGYTINTTTNLCEKFTNKFCPYGTLSGAVSCNILFSKFSSIGNPMQPVRIANIYVRQCVANLGTPIQNRLYYVSSNPTPPPCDLNTTFEDIKITSLSGVNSIYWKRCTVDVQPPNDHVYFMNNVGFGNGCPANTNGSTFWRDEGQQVVDLYINPVLYLTRCYYSFDKAHLFYFTANAPSSCEVSPSNNVGLLENYFTIDTVASYSCTNGYTTSGSACLGPASCPSSYTDNGSNCIATLAPTSFSCPAGQFLTNTGTDSCTPCPAGSYCSGGVGAVATPCPPNTSSLASSTSASACTPNDVSLSLRAFLSGAFKVSTGLMNTQLASRNLLPVSQPFNVAGTGTNPLPAYTGTEVLPAVASRATNITDWVLLEVRSSDAANYAITTKACVILSDGTIVDAINATAANQSANASSTTANDPSNTTNKITLTGLSRNTNYKLVIRHRNHIAVANDITKLPLSFDTTTGRAAIDLTLASNNLPNTTNPVTNQTIVNSKIKGNNQILLNPPTTQNPNPTPIYGLRAGDANSTKSVDASDRNLLNTSEEFDGTYDIKDLSLDGQIDATDRNLSQNAGEALENV